LSIDHQGNQRLTIHPHLGADFLNAEQFKNPVVVLALVKTCILIVARLQGAKPWLATTSLSLKLQSPLLLRP
tara:strand:- start:72 stop:287 length:216 start_codon:yes stop_codon:yes gene_type:complete